MDRQDRESRRAENQVWNGWGQYGKRPELVVMAPDGGAELYGNTVLGLVARYFDFERFKPLLNELHRAAEEGLYTDVFFLVLEGAVFARGAEERPVLPQLRREYAARLLETLPAAEGMTDGALRRAWAQSVLGKPVEEARMTPLLEALASPV